MPEVMKYGFGRGRRADCKRARWPWGWRRRPSTISRGKRRIGPTCCRRTLVARRIGNACRGHSRGCRRSAVCSGDDLRGRANSLVLRATQAAPCGGEGCGLCRRAYRGSVVPRSAVLFGVELSAGAYSTRICANSPGSATNYACQELPHLGHTWDCGRQAARAIRSGKKQIATTICQIGMPPRLAAAPHLGQVSSAIEVPFKK